MFKENTLYITLDDNFQIVYASDELREKYKGLFLPDFFRNLLSGYDLDSFDTPLEFQAGISGTEDIKLVILKDDVGIRCLPVKSRIYGENRHKNIHYRLREPLTSIFAILPIIADDVDKNNQDKAIMRLETVNRQSYKLLRNVNNISLTDRIMSGNLPAAGTINLSSLINTLVNSIYTVYNKISFKTDIDENVFINGNKSLITCALLNLVSNSINFSSDEKVLVEITLKSNGSQAAFTFADNSKGIKDEYITDIFKPYFSKDPYADGENDPSLGLGLFIVKNAFEQAGGKIMTSSVFGKGVKYVVNLPVTENGGCTMESSSSEFLLNRYSDLFVQLCDSCQLPSLK